MHLVAAELARRALGPRLSPERKRGAKLGVCSVTFRSARAYPVRAVPRSTLCWVCSVTFRSARAGVCYFISFSSRSFIFLYSPSAFRGSKPLWTYLTTPSGSTTNDAGIVDAP